MIEATGKIVQDEVGFHLAFLTLFLLIRQVRPTLYGLRPLVDTDGASRECATDGAIRCDEGNARVVRHRGE